MCGILFCEGKETEDFQKAYGCMVHRGPDMSRKYETSKGLFGFHRLAIMDTSEKGMQPFVKDAITLMVNGEIYNELKLVDRYKDYPFVGHSDCETLIPLYLDKGSDMCVDLDAEFAFVLWDEDKQKLLAARDPIGIRPLFYGYQKDSLKIAFASEMKSLLPLCDKVLPFPPGHIYDNGQFIQYYDVTKTHDSLLNEEEALRAIREKLTQGVEKRMMSDVPIAYLLSGGLDSSLVCALAAKQSKGPIKTFAIGMQKDAIDLKYAAQVARHIGSDHTEVYMSTQEVLDSVKEVIYHLETFDITTIRASIGMYLLTKAIHEKSDVKVLLTGEISDELFGYKYTDFAPDAISFQKESEKRLKELHLYDVLRADRCIAAWSLEARVPFGDLDFVKDVMSIDPKLKMNRTGMGKYLLRQAFAKDDLLPSSILWREKAAFSDAVGHSMVDDLKAYAEKHYSDEDLLAAKTKYPHVTPHTKEALWYRDIFESFYPNQSHVIPSFWMPNPEWVGASITDPSARFLSNYNKSGE